MTAVDNSGLVELYLASIWRYHYAGIERVLEALRNGHPRGQYTFEEESGCFKVSCRPSEVYIVQSVFRKVHSELESSLDSQKVFTAHVSFPRYISRR